MKYIIMILEVTTEEVTNCRTRRYVYGPIVCVCVYVCVCVCVQLP
jgi:hypothetical protein